ncbi:MAG: tyrosine-type recombinase/integrase, partial [Solirubrobacteraceae bacterium]
RTTFTPDQRRATLAAAEERRDRIALRLLFDYGIRKGTLKAVQFKHFDHQRRRLTTFGKGGKVRDLPIPDPNLWMDLERHILDVGARPSDYLMCRHRMIPVGTPDAAGRRRTELRRFPEKPMSDHGLHRWWYGRLADAGITEPGVLAGERMHKARHTAGQRMLDRTGNLKAVQKLLDHTTIQTTADIYTDWDVDQLTASLAAVLAEDDDG